MAERRFHRLGLARIEDAGAHQALDIRQAARHIVFKETSVEAERRAKLERGRIGLVRKSSGPEIRHAGAGYLAAGSGCFAL